jgi:hypothetical protein
MISCPVNLRQSFTLIAAVGAAITAAGCGRTLVFIERDGVNLAIRTSGSTPPLEVNFGLNRTIATIGPPAGEKGDAVSMFAGFQVDNTLDVAKALNADMQIDTQFASGKAATAVARKPQVVAQIVSMRELTFSTSESTSQLFAWLYPDEKRSKTRFSKLEEWLKRRYPGKDILPGDLRTNSKEDDYEAIRKAALADTALIATPKH